MRRSRGFTLLEVVLAITIVVMLMGTLAATLSIALKSKRSTEESLMSVRDVYSVADILVQELQSAHPPSPMSNVDQLAAQFNTQTTDETGAMVGTSTSVPGFIYGPFLGDNQSIGFYATGPEPKAVVQSDSRYVLFAVEAQEDGTQALVRHVEPNLLSDTSPSDLPTEQSGELQKELLVANVQSVSFQYYDGAAWATEWDSTQLENTLPYAVKIEIILNPLHENGPARVITRFATLWCAESTVSAAATAAAAVAETQPALGGGF